MSKTRLTLGVIVEKSSDFDTPVSVRILGFTAGRAYSVPTEKLPSSVDLGDWVSSRSTEFDDTITQTKRAPLRSRLVDGQVQVFSYFSIIPNHCSMRDHFIPPQHSKVWSPHLGFANSEPNVMFKLKDDILYEAWFEYSSGRSENHPIWELKSVGKALIDPSITILLAQTPWKMCSRRAEMVDMSLSTALHASRPEEDRYHHGIVIALLNTSDKYERKWRDDEKKEVVLHCSSYGGIVSTDSRKMQSSVYDQLSIGQIVKFREWTDPTTKEKYPEIKEILLTTRRDIQFEVKRERNTSLIKLRTSVGIDEDLLEDGEEGTIKFVCDYGRITVSREKFSKQLETAVLEKNDLLEAKKEGKELLVWIQYVPVGCTWNIFRIDENWFTDKPSPKTSD